MRPHPELQNRIDVITRQIKLLTQAVRELREMVNHHDSTIEDLAENMRDPHDAHIAP